MLRAGVDSFKRLLTIQSDAKRGVAMALPVVLLLFFFLLTPFLFSFYFSMTNQRLFSPNKTEWVGLQNYRQLFTMRTFRQMPMVDVNGAIARDASGVPQYQELREITRNNPAYPQYNGLYSFITIDRDEHRWMLLARDPLFLRSVINTIGFVFFVAPLQSGFALMLALLLNTKLRGVYLFRTIYFMPVVISIVVVAMLWRFILDGDSGLLNTLLGLVSFGVIKPIGWLSSTTTAPIAIIMMSIWQAVGFHMLIWLAGLQQIPTNRYEAATIDGANMVQQFKYVTWPGLHNTAVFVLVIITMQAFGLFAQIDVMTSGGPLDSTQSIVYQIIERGYRKQNIAGGSAISLFYFLLVLVVSMTQRKLTQQKS